MLNPEVWTFKAPKPTFSISISDIADTSQLGRRIDSFYFNHLVSIVTPQDNSSEELRQALLADSDYYKIPNLTLDTVLDKSFIRAFIKQGHITAVTIDARVDCDNTLCITPCGKLILLLTKEAYRSLGIPGKVSQYTKSQKNLNKYVVTLDLLKERFVQNKTNADVQQCLKKLGCFSIVITWDATTLNVCPSSIAKYFCDNGYDVTVCTNEHRHRTRNPTHVPEFQFGDEEMVYDLMEWMGMITLDCDVNPELHMSTYTTCETRHRQQVVQINQFRGFFTANRIRKLFQFLEKHWQSEWFLFYVQGFSDAPVNWKCNEHHFYTNGDTGYMVAYENSKYALVANCTSNKQYK